ncbi:MAG: ethanolamine utilization protein EutN [Kiritimatiellia bacterium]|jgi:ethanolamine utilization protein EutN
MRLGLVCGTVVATQQHSFYRGRKQLLVRYTLPDGSFDGDDYVVAVDAVDAGVGQVVLVQDEGNSSRQMLGTCAHGPVRSVIVGIVDSVSTS